jgi:hypothetical protein
VTPAPGRAYAAAVTQTQDPGELARMARRLTELRMQHRDLDTAIARLQADIEADELAVKRLKKRKLQLKDCIARLESALIPDEPA